MYPLASYVTINISSLITKNLRQLPGEGDLALHDILDKLDPQLPLSLEIRSRELMQRSVGDPNARARIVFLAMQHFLRSSIA